MIRPLRRRLRRRDRAATVRVMVIIENVSLARDHRARKQVDSLLRRGYRVGVISRRDPENRRYLSAGMALYEYPAPIERPGKVFFALEYAYSLAAAGALLVRALADGRYQIIQAGHPPDIYFLLGGPAKLVGARFVVDQRDLSPEVFADRFDRQTGLLPRVLRGLERASWRVADHVFCVNSSLEMTILTRGAVPPSKVSVVGNGPRLASVRAHGHAHPRRPGPYRICWLGVMGRQDHLELAVSAIRYYVHDLGRNDARFVFIGDGEALPDTRAMCAELGLDDYVTFTGWLSEEECFAHLADADLGLDTNLQAEVTPVKGLEYLSFSVPMVGFDLHETRALAGPAARYVAPGDVAGMAREVARLLDSPEERAEMGRAGRERIDASLAWERQEPAYVGAIERMIGPRSAHAGAPPLAEGS
jgi:glycosyltransferase involved in cell wall biosynthesis